MLDALTHASYVSLGTGEPDERLAAAGLDGLPVVRDADTCLSGRIRVLRLDRRAHGGHGARREETRTPPGSAETAEVSTGAAAASGPSDTSASERGAMSASFLVQEQTPSGEVLVRRFATRDDADAFVDDRLQTYDRMWDGCGCKVRYYENG